MVRPMTPSRETWERHLRETEREGQSRRIRCRICSRRFRLIPRMINNSSIRRNGGFFLRYSTILCAVASPIPGRVFSSATVARLTLICEGGRAPAFVWVRFWGSFPLSHTPELGTDNTKKRPADIAATRIQISCCDPHPMRCLSKYTSPRLFVSTPSPESFGECRGSPSSRHETPDRRTRESKSKLERTKTVVWA